MFASETPYEAEQWRRAISFVQLVRHLVLRFVFLLFGDLLALPGQLRRWLEKSKGRSTDAAVRTAKVWMFKTITYVPNILILVWIYNLYRGEYSIFNAAIESCDWNRWENWVRTISANDLNSSDTSTSPLMQHLTV